MNHSGVLFLNAFASGTPEWRVLTVFSAEWLIFFFPVALLIIVFVRYPRDLGTISFLSLSSMCLAAASAATISFLFPVSRPFLAVPDLISQLVPVVNPLGSFPSGHSAVAMAFAVTLFLRGKYGLGSIALFCAIVVGLGRVASGVHYPIDMIGGLLLGAFSAFFVSRLYFWMKEGG